MPKTDKQTFLPSSSGNSTEGAKLVSCDGSGLNTQLSPIEENRRLNRCATDSRRLLTPVTLSVGLDGAFSSSGVVSSDLDCRFSPAKLQPGTHENRLLDLRSVLIVSS